MVVLAGVLVLGTHALLERRRIQRLVERRRGESICQFARSFPRRTMDPRVLRAVYTEIGDRMVGKPAGFPLRAGDRLDQVCGIYCDELDELGEDLAFVTGRSLEGTRANPYFDRVRTVRDLVMFLHHQPSRQAAV
jgi:hypothetical protein